MSRNSVFTTFPSPRPGGHLLGPRVLGTSRRQTWNTMRPPLGDARRGAHSTGARIRYRRGAALAFVALQPTLQTLDGQPRRSFRRSFLRNHKGIFFLSGSQESFGKSFWHEVALWVNVRRNVPPVDPPFSFCQRKMARTICP